ncbi:sideroflexin-4 isoform X1 [Ornithorhynchus anatinus]|uniref:Sideroflexin 4 n=1 Tax=Ornithorhynchus anatinus TaxID=9258 RepID=F6SX90_ORNAN|nr:sideroflexin-4 isoform X1 [Ornithorhynchus anatinus]
MEPNLQFWSREGQTFSQRFRRWTEILEPTNLLFSEEDVQNSRLLLTTKGRASAEHGDDDQQFRAAWKQSLSSVHPDSGRLIPVPFRPAAFLPSTVPLLYLSLLPPKGIKTALFPQLMFHLYTTQFSIVNGNATNEKYTFMQQLLGATTVFSSTIFGICPRLIMTRYALNGPTLQMVITKVLPIPLLAFFSMFNVVVCRSPEYQYGIEVMDKDGSVIGVSRQAGAKAVKETALSRGLLFGVSALVPSALTPLLKRTSFVLQNPRFLVLLKLNLTVLVMGLMVPTSFSLFTQTGRIHRVDLEEEIQASTEETELFYNRGL